MPKKRKKKTETRADRIARGMAKGFQKDIKDLDRRIQADPDLRRNLEVILSTNARIDAKAREHFFAVKVPRFLGWGTSRALSYFLSQNDPDLLEAIRKKVSPSEETMRFLNDALIKYGYELEDILERSSFENHWASLRSESSYSVERNQLQTRIEILTVSHKPLILEGRFGSILHMACALVSSLREDLESAKKAVPDLTIWLKPKALEDLQHDVEIIKKLCAELVKKID